MLASSPAQRHGDAIRTQHLHPLVHLCLFFVHAVIPFASPTDEPPGGAYPVGGAAAALPLDPLPH